MFDEFDEGEELHPCYKCGVAAGQRHQPACALEQCPYCGTFVAGFTCFCETKLEAGIPEQDRLPWTGRWPGTVECRELGWYAKRNPCGPGWVQCGPEEIQASYDLNRLLRETVWDRVQKRFVLPEQQTLQGAEMGRN